MFSFENLIEKTMNNDEKSPADNDMKKKLGGISVLLSKPVCGWFVNVLMYTVMYNYYSMR